MAIAPIAWLAGTGALLLCVGTGIGLGNFAAGHDHGRWAAQSEISAPIASVATATEDDVTQQPADAHIPVSSAADEPVVCKGCGPTLAERQAGGMDGALGYGLGQDDPVVRRYLRQAAAEEADWRRRDAELSAAPDSLPVEEGHGIPVPN